MGVFVLPHRLVHISVIFNGARLRVVSGTVVETASPLVLDAT